MKVSIGKNTLGGGKKMMTRLNNYNRSTHDLSCVVRTTAAPGVLIPTLKILVLPGDTFNIKTRVHTLTHPTVGPLFGSFKQQNDFFFCPIRLYNAMLHNNALNIGLDMKKVKFPKINILTSNLSYELKMKGSGGTLLDQVNPSSLPSYLGFKSPLTENGSDSESKFNGITYAMYFDIFKNYYANKQEANFYTIGGNQNLPFSTSIEVDDIFFLSNAKKVASGNWPNNTLNKNEGSYLIGGDQNSTYYFTINLNTDNDISNYEINAIIKVLNGPNPQTIILQGTINQLVASGLIKKINVSQEPGVTTSSYIVKGTEAAGNSIRIDIGNGITITSAGGKYLTYNLTDIDNMRESILAAGRTEYSFANDKFITDIFDIVDSGEEGRQKLACSNPMTGLALKTYQSDINTNWVNTEWIDGETGINAITAIDTSSGSFTLDTLNLAKKVYTMLNRIAVSDGSYNAWIQTVYTSGGLNHIETPIYLGGSSLEIEFQEVINNSGTEEQPLGTLAGRGIATNHKGGNIIFKADEPGYIFCITSITPRVDYFQGNDWDCYLDTIDDLHKPQLDGIGFQDRLYRSINANSKQTDILKSIGKQPAWIEYMTNVNKTYGNFALIENEGWMCLNRIFGDIDTYTTYVQPHLYNNIFADIDLTAQNFWIQIGFDIESRRVMSAKVIPNI